MGSMRSTWGAPAYGKRRGRGLRSKNVPQPQFQPGAPLNEQTARELQQGAGNKATSEAAKKAAGLEQFHQRRSAEEQAGKEQAGSEQAGNEQRKLADSELQEMMARLADSPYGVSREDTELLAANGYRPGALHRPAGGLAYRTFIPIDGGDAVVAFQRLALKRDMSDMGSAGAKDLLAKVEATEGPLKNLVAQHGPVIVTGQDSGGGAAQLVEATHTHMVSDIATFNSPQVDSDAIAKLAAKDDRAGSDQAQGDKSPAADSGDDGATKTAGRAEGEHDEGERDETRAAATNDTAATSTVEAKAGGSPTEERAARAAASIMGVTTEDRARQGAESGGPKESAEQDRVEAQPAEKAAEEQDEKAAQAGEDVKGEDVEAEKDGVDSRDSAGQEAGEAKEQKEQEAEQQEAEQQQEAGHKVTEGQDTAADEKQSDGEPGADDGHDQTEEPAALHKPEEAAEREAGEKDHQAAAHEVAAVNLVEKAQAMRNEVSPELRAAWDHIVDALRRGESVQSQEEIINLCEVSDTDAGVLLEQLHRLHDLGNA